MADKIIFLAILLVYLSENPAVNAKRNYAVEDSDPALVNDSHEHRNRHHQSSRGDGTESRDTHYQYSSLSDRYSSRSENVNSHPQFDERETGSRNSKHSSYQHSGYVPEKNNYHPASQEWHDKRSRNSRHPSSFDRRGSHETDDFRSGRRQDDSNYESSVNRRHPSEKLVPASEIHEEKSVHQSSELVCLGPNGFPMTVQGSKCPHITLPRASKRPHGRRDNHHYKNTHSRGKKKVNYHRKDYKNRETWKDSFLRSIPDWKKLKTSVVNIFKGKTDIDEHHAYRRT